jgi:hypothetical protein
MKNPFTEIRIEALLQSAEDAEQAAHAEEEKAKVGVLRGGSSGILTDSGDVHGNCPRLSLARFLGVNTPPDRDSMLYFAAGYGNEDRWLELLKAAYPGRVLSEDEIPIRWEIGGSDPSKPAIQVTGRPDIVLCDDAGVPQLGIELKAVCSSYRAVQVFLAVAPDSKHLIQAAHYSWQMGKLPWLVSYTSESSYDTPYYAIKKYGADRKIKPKRQHFYCGWDGDTFTYIDPVTAEPVPTKITPRSIENYYRLVAAQAEHKQLGPRPAATEVYGDGKAFDACKYCPFSDACDTYDNDGDYDHWLATIRSTTNESD